MPISNRHGLDPTPIASRLGSSDGWSWRSFLLSLLIPVAFSAIAWASASINYLVFHVTAELFSIVIASTALIVALTSRRFTQNHFVVFLAVTIGWCGAIDLLHTLVYKGMNLLPVNESNLATQLWIVARFLQALALLIATYFLRHSLKTGFAVIGFGLFSALFVLMAIMGLLPDAFVEGQGLTHFKINMEYMIIGIMTVALWSYWKNRTLMSKALFINMVFAVVSLIVAEFAFTQYANVYAKSNMLGHILKIFGYWFIYQALVHNTLKEPFSALSRAANSFDSVPEPTVLISKDGRIQQINNAAADIAKRSKDLLVGADAHSIFHDANVQKQQCLVCQRIAQGESAFAQSLRLHDGRMVRCTVSPFTGDEANDQLVQVIDDITFESELSSERDHLMYSLNERLKELDCLNKISNLSQQTGLDVRAYVQAVLTLLPKAFRYSDKALVSIKLYHYGFEHAQTDFSQHACIQRPLSIHQRNVGELIAYYPGLANRRDEVFLVEEESFMDTVAQSVGEGIERIEAVKRSQQLNFLYDTLSATNRAMVRAQTRDELLSDFFEVLSKTNAFPVLFLAKAERHESEVRLILAKTNGVPDDLLEKITLAVCDPAGLITQRLSHLKHGLVDVEELTDITGPSEWVQFLLGEEINVRLLVPLFVEQKLVSIVGLYGRNLEAFDEEQLRLLNQLSVDVSFGLNDLLASERIWKSEQALIESEAHFRSMIEQSAAGMYVRRKDRFVYVNPRYCEIVGYSSDELVDQQVYRFVPSNEETLKHIHEAWEKLDAGAPSVTYLAPFLRRDGRQLELELHAKRIDWDGEPAHIVLVDDITERKRQQEKINAYVSQLESMMRATLEAVANMVEMRDPYTAGHEKRVGELARDIGRELGWAEDRCRQMELVGLVHDIGKIAVPAEILTKPTKLTDIEMQLMRIHPQAGYDIIKHVPFPLPVADIIYQHHERMDGSGYPRGLKGDEILPESRVLAVADVIESMATHRPYRAARGIGEALAEIERHAGSLYDPEVCDAALRMFRDKGYQLPA